MKSRMIKFSPEFEPPSASQCDIPNSEAAIEFEPTPLTPSAVVFARCKVDDGPSEDNAVNPSIGVGWWFEEEDEFPLLDDELCFKLCPASVAAVTWWCWYKWLLLLLLLYRLLLMVVIAWDCDNAGAPDEVCAGLFPDDDDVDRFKPPPIRAFGCKCR